jgi:hypothetical protein
LTLLTPTFKSNMINDFVTNIDTNEYYIFAGKTIGYSSNNVTAANNSVDGYFHNIEHEMLFGKKISSGDYNLMVKNTPWEANTIYTQYDNQQVDLEDSNFFVVSKEGVDYGVFKCINNNNGIESTIQPLPSETSAFDELYQTSDGYVWKYMYSITDAQYKRFATTDYVPFFENEDVANNAVDGSINAVVVTSSGLDYDQIVEGTIAQTNVEGSNKKFYVQGNEASLTSTTNYYKNNAIYITEGTGAGQLRKIVSYGTEGNFKFIVVDSAFETTPESGDVFEIAPNVIATGDGTGFQARAIVSDSGSFVEKIEIINRGMNYSYADISIELNDSIKDSEVYKQAEARAILSPKGGHGSNQQDELFAHHLGFSSFFIETEVPGEGNDFRTIGLIKNPTFNCAIIEIDSISGIAVGNTVNQVSTGASGTISDIDEPTRTITLEDVTGVFSSDVDETVVINEVEYDIVTIDKNTKVFDQRLKLDVSYIFGTEFEQDELLIQGDGSAEGYLYNAKDGSVYLINTKGTFTISATEELIGQTTGTRALINSVGQKDMKEQSEEILYVQNIIPVTRTVGNTERVKIILGL